VARGRKGSEQKADAKAAPEVLTPEIVEDSEAIEGEIVDLEIDASDAPPVIEAELLDDSVTADAPEVIDEPESTAVVRFDPLDHYLAEIRRHPPLSREEEHTLAVRFQETGDRQAAYKLIVSNLRLVVMIAKEYQRNFQNILDLVQEGNIGLLEAVKQFDPFRGIRFPSYAAYWIRAYILRYLINNIRLVKVGTTQAQRKLFFNLQKEKDRLEAEGFHPEANLLAKRLGVKESEVLEMEQRLALPDLSVDAPIKGTEGEIDYHGLIADSRVDLEQTVSDQQFGQALRSAVGEFKAKLGEREQAIIDRRLFTEDPVTLQEIADQFSLSRERIRQIETRLKEELKEFLQRRLQLGDEGEAVIEDGPD